MELTFSFIDELDFGISVGYVQPDEDSDSNTAPSGKMTVGFIANTETVSGIMEEI